MMRLNRVIDLQRNFQCAAAIFQGNHGLLTPAHRIKERLDLGSQRFT
jgi:hypothetical protein